MSSQEFSGSAQDCPGLSVGFDDALLVKVEKPVRYLGNEINSIRKDLSAVKFRLALAFPDVYEVGQSHLGLKILYSIVNAEPEFFAERLFAVWPDMEEQMRNRNEPLRTHETGTPVREMDVLGFSLQYELCSTGVLQILDLAGIPLRSEHRSDDDPVVLAGGPAAFNPLPLADFIDAFALGDGEDMILDLARSAAKCKEDGLPREDILRQWAQIEGVYVPSLHGTSVSVRRRIVEDLGRVDFPSDPVVPFCEIVHDRIGIEIARGCTRGCRFCQAGMLYRPVRERSQADLLRIARRSLASTGWEELSLLSLSSGDYTGICDLVKALSDEFSGEKVAVSLPSLRTDTFSGEIAEYIRRVRKTGFTLAPEAGTDRLRRVINKGNTDEDLERAVSTAVDLGWRAVKLYFMVGLPTETRADLEGIGLLVRKVARLAKSAKIMASVSTFVPKSHTPFQWARQISIDETHSSQQYLRSLVRHPSVRWKFHDARVSFLEGVFARGDRRLASVIEAAFRNGARFDAWDDRLKFDVWMEAFDETGIDPQQFLHERDPGSILPWDFIHTGISKEFLIQEWHKAVSEENTPDCRAGDCQGCGVCDFREIKPVLASAAEDGAVQRAASEPTHGERIVRRFRLHYRKWGPMRFVGHQDLIRVFYRALRRARITLDFSKGFHPHPRLRFTPPLAVGVESVAEYLEFDTLGEKSDPQQLFVRLSEQLPVGIQTESLVETLLNESSLSARIRALSYEMVLPESLGVDEARRRLQEFLAAGSFEITRTHKGRRRTRDLRPLVEECSVNGSSVSLTLHAGPDGSVHPVEAFAAVTGLGKEEVRSCHITKTSVRLE